VTVLARLFRCIAPSWPWLTAAVVGMVVTVGADLVVPWLLRTTIDSVLLARDYGALRLVSLLVVGAALLRGVFYFLQRYSMEYAAQRTIRDLRGRLFHHLQRLSFSFHDAARTGDLISRTTSDTEMLRRFVGFGVISLVSNLLTFTMVIGLLLWLDWRLTLVSLASLPLMLYVLQRFAGRVRPAYRAIQQQIAELTAVLHETIIGIRAVRAFGQEGREARRFDDRNRACLEQHIEATRLWAYYAPFLNFAAAIGTAAVVTFGGYEVLTGRLTVGELVAFYSYLAMMVMPLRMLGWIVSLSQQAVASGQRVFDVLDAEVDIRDHPAAGRLPRPRGHVVFDGVSFAYPTSPDRPVLEDVDLDIRPGEVVALVGGSGAGKSSLVQLIPRFYDPTAGRVLVDGHDLRHVTMDSLRRQVGIVLQESFLFNASIAENIAYGRPGAGRAEIIAAARVAQVHDFIESLPQGYDTEVGERGMTLSGGQRQRLAIARVLLVDPAILIFDDSLASVDSETEHRLQQSLFDLARGRTTFIIAHRLSTVRRAGRVVVMDRGRIVQSGTHEDLMASEGLYQGLYRAHTEEVSGGAHGPES